MGILKFIGSKLFANDKEVALKEDIPDTRGQATAWAVVDKSTNTLISSYNMTFTSGGMGLLVMSFETPMDNTDYVVVATGGATSNTPTNSRIVAMRDTDNKTVNSFKLYFNIDVTILTDNGIVNVVVYGGKN